MVTTLDKNDAARIIADGEEVDRHTGETQHREYNSAIDGRPWIYPGEVVVEHEGQLYVYTIEGPFKKKEY
tara:strand:- start:767 stop:976 length:210 start_codon:yes stop_codon:yes gene_type:complete